jgi:hypothetical protein
MKPSRKNLSTSRSGNVEYHELDIKHVKEEEKRRHLLNKIDAIDRTLKEVRDTRSFKVSQSSLAPDVARPLTPQDTRGDGSYIIDTTTPQLTTCPHCFVQLSVRELRGHMQKSCTQKMVQCPERGCSAVLPQNELKEHMKNGCFFAKKRRSLAAVSVKRREDIQNETIKRIEAHKSKPALPFQPQSHFQQHNDDDHDGIDHDHVSSNDDIEITFRPKAPPVEEEALIQCDNCKDMIPEDRFKAHANDECRFRKIYCTNRHMGCMDEVPLCEMNLHLKQSCVVEQKKDELVSRSRKRRQEVRCPGCGDTYELQYLRQHENTTCPNRKVPCRNHALGCEVVVRLKDRKDHEDVTNGVKPRPCLFFDGQDTRLLLEEDDVTPPWTTEVWVYRPSLLESARCHMREVKRLVKLFRDCILEECLERGNVMDLKNSLEVFARKGGDGIAEITVRLAQQLLVYEKAALDTCMHGQLLLVAVTTVIAEIAELQVFRPVKDIVDIRPNVTGKLCLKTYVVKGIDDGDGKAKKDSDLSKEEAEDIAKQSQEINEQMEILKKILADKEKSNADADAESFSVKTHEPMSTGNPFGNENADEQKGEGEDSEDQKANDNNLPDGFDAVKTNIDDYDWCPKRWRDWGKIAQGILTSLDLDQKVLRSWRLDVGLVRMTDEEKKALKQQQQGGKVDAKADAKAKKEAAKAAKREKREKKKRKSGKDVNTSNFAANFENIQRMYSGSEPICVGPDACIYLNLSGVPIPGKASKKKKNDAVSDTDDDSDVKSSKKGKGEKPVQGTFGFADKVEGLHSFNVKIPREKWTHIIVKCTKKPKKRIQVYTNSILVGTLKDHYFNLPMQSIGSEYLSLHGYLLDVRFWAKERSFAEMKFGMHNLLNLAPAEGHDVPPKMKRKKEPEKPKNIHWADMSGDQLIGWWTFEDGFYSKSAQDLSGNRFPSAIAGGKLHMSKHRQTHWYEAATLVELTVQRKLLADSKTDADEDLKLSVPPPLVIPMPSFLERNLCRFEVKRAKLAQRGRALMKEAKCPLGCKEKIRKVDMRFHLKHACERRKITCRFKFCGKTYMAMDALWHESSDDCAAISARDEVLRTGAIDRKLYQCDMCSEKIQSRHFINHQENLCQHRLIKCPNADCHKHLIPAHTLKYHLEVKCKSAAVQQRKLLITRARGTRSYARPWGVSVAYQPGDGDDSEDSEGEEEEVE